MRPRDARAHHGTLVVDLAEATTEEAFLGELAAALRVPVQPARADTDRLAQLGRARRIAARIDRDGELETRIVRLLAAARAIAARVERAVDRHPVHPGEELAAALELGERAVRLQKHFLRDVVGLARGASDVKREREDALAIALHERLERLAVPLLRGVDDLAHLLVSEAVPEVDRRRRLVVERMNALPGVTCITPKGAFYAFPNVSATGWKAKPLANALLDEAGVALIGGPDFGTLGEGYLRLSYANSEENIARAADRMADFLATQKAPA